MHSVKRPPGALHSTGARKQSPMLMAAILRSRGAAWLHQLAPTAGSRLRASGGAVAASAGSRRSVTGCGSAAAHPQASEVEAATPSAAETASHAKDSASGAGRAGAEGVPRRRGRPRKRDPASLALAREDAAAVSFASDAAAAGIHPSTTPPRRRSGRPRKVVLPVGGASGAAGEPPVDTVLLVESPAKARKIQEFLGDDYKVIASYGHVCDLPPRPGSVVPAAGFKMMWQLTQGAEERVAAIAAAVQGSRRLVLATDPDREGEADRKSVV